jgi:hypothetical protein
MCCIAFILFRPKVSMLAADRRDMEAPPRLIRDVTGQNARRSTAVPPYKPRYVSVRSSSANRSPTPSPQRASDAETNSAEN